MAFTGAADAPGLAASALPADEAGECSAAAVEEEGGAAGAEGFSAEGEAEGGGGGEGVAAAGGGGGEGGEGCGSAEAESDRVSFLCSAVFSLPTTTVSPFVAFSSPPPRPAPACVCGADGWRETGKERPPSMPCTPVPGRPMSAP